MKLFAAFFFVFGLLVAGPVAAEDKMEDFSFKDIDGQVHDTKSYRGKWMIVNYWGTYCAPCLEEIPDLISFADKYKKDAIILGLDAGGTDIKGLQEFVDEYMINYPVAPVQESTLDAFGVLIGIPTSYVISPSGEIMGKVVGIIDLEEVEQLMGVSQASTASTTPEGYDE